MPQPPADPDRFGEAVEHFRNRVPVNPAAYNRLDAKAKRKAFTVGDVAQLDLVADVWGAIDSAINDGSSFEDFRAAVTDKLQTAWGGEKPYRLELIFRNAIQTSYSAGRWKQMKDPAITRYRPYWRYNVILDSRTSEICRELANTTLPADDPFWDSHNPPLHHGCRSGVMSLTTEQAADLGITTDTPETEAQEGFGLAPGADEWQPDLSEYPAALVKIFNDSGQ